MFVNFEFLKDSPEVFKKKLTFYDSPGFNNNNIQNWFEKVNRVKKINSFDFIILVLSFE